jgi:hypothetical protein
LESWGSCIKARKLCTTSDTSGTVGRCEGAALEDEVALLPMGSDELAATGAATAAAVGAAVSAEEEAEETAATRVPAG